MPGTYRCALCIKALLRANPCNDGKEIVMITSGIQSFALSHGEQYKHGRTSLRDLSGKLPFVANGCTMLLCVEGRAVVTTNTRKRTFRKGDLLVLFSDTLFAPLCVSPSFTAEYISLSLELTGRFSTKWLPRILGRTVWISGLPTFGSTILIGRRSVQADDMGDGERWWRKPEKHPAKLHLQCFSGFRYCVQADVSRLGQVLSKGSVKGAVRQVHVTAG